MGCPAPELAGLSGRMDWPHTMPATSNLTAPAQTSSSASAAHLCIVIDEDPRLRHFLSLILHGAGADALEFSDGAEFRSKRLPRPGNVVFLNIGSNTKDATSTLEALGKARYCGAVQLMSA